MDELRPGDPSFICLLTKYSGWEDLAAKWRRGVRDLSPCRHTWEYCVRNDILFREIKGTDVVAGMASVSRGEDGLRYFFYRMSNWRNRLSDRAKLSSLGGIPVMDVELAEMLEGLDLPFPRPGSNEREALDFVRKWVEQKGKVWDGEGADWYGHDVRYRVQAAGLKLRVAYKPEKRSAPAAVDVARFDLGQGALYVKGQAGRNKAVSWIRDALYSAVAIASGAGMLRGYKMIYNDFLTRIDDIVIGIKPVPKGILDREGISRNSHKITLT